MLEFYMAYADYQDLMNFSERLLCFIAEKTLGKLKIESQGNQIDLTPPWSRISLSETVLERNQLDPSAADNLKKLWEVPQNLRIQFQKEDSSGKILQLLFEKTVEPTLIQPTFVTDYPTDTSPLAKRKMDDPSRTDRFELFIGGIEMANGFSELNDPQDQRARFEDQVKKRAGGDQEAHPLDEDYLRALEHGMPPTAGEGVGLDRIIMLFTSQTSIREVILFPQLRPEQS